MEQNPSSEANSSSPSQEISEFCWTSKFICVFTTARHLFLPWGRLIQSTHPVKSILIHRLYASTFRLAPFVHIPLQKLCMNFTSPPYVLRPPPISSSLISSLEWHFVRSANHEARHYAVFFTPLSPHHSQSQIPSSAPQSQTPSAYVLSLMCEGPHKHFLPLFLVEA